MNITHYEKYTLATKEWTKQDEVRMDEIYRTLINKNEYQNQLWAFENQPEFKAIRSNYYSNGQLGDGSMLDKEDYPFIALDIDRIVEMFLMAERFFPEHFKKDFNFYDIGSGFGNVLHIVQNLYPTQATVYGIEKYRLYQELAGFIKPTIMTDIMDMKTDMFDQSKPCVFYAYNPLRMDDAMQKASIHIMKTLPRGSLFMFRKTSGYTMCYARKHIDRVVAYGKCGSYSNYFIKIRDHEE